MSARVITPGRAYQTESKECSKMQSKYDSKQLNKYERKQNGIEAIKILKATEEFLEIPLPHVFGENKTTQIPMRDTECFKQGDYIDVTLAYTTTGGESHSFCLKFWGPTPPEFTQQSKKDERRN